MKTGDMVKLKNSGKVGYINKIYYNNDGIESIDVYFPEDNITERYRPEALQAVQKETDPMGLSMSTPGAKADAGKLKMFLVLKDFSLALQEVAKVGTMGAEKYSLSGWLQVPDGYARYSDAMMRHVFEIGDAEFDHDAHAAWNALARLELKIRGTK